MASFHARKARHGDISDASLHQSNLDALVSKEFASFVFAMSFLHFWEPLLAGRLGPLH